jgi:hypothetical protein
MNHLNTLENNLSITSAHAFTVMEIPAILEATSNQADSAMPTADIEKELATPSEVLCGPCLRLLRYGNQPSRQASVPMIRKLPAHFDVKALKVDGPYSLHTEYSGKPRRLDSPLLEGFESLLASQRNKVPELWSSAPWAKDFGSYIFRLVGDEAPPSAIEFHPPFRSTTPTIDAFLDIYQVFEEAMAERFPDCELLIENRSGSNHPSPFLVSDIDSILALGQALAVRNLRLRIALDLPQLFTAMWGSKRAVGMEGVKLIQRLEPIREQIHTLHLWGRGANGGAHSGGLDSLFAPGSGAKEACLKELRRILDDGEDRHLVLEVSRQSDMEAILTDLEASGFVIR